MHKFMGLPSSRGCPVSQLSVSCSTTRSGAHLSRLRPRARYSQLRQRTPLGISDTRCRAASGPDEGLSVSTYSGDDSLWGTQELSRLVEFLPKDAGDGLLLTRGTWSSSTPKPGIIRLTGRCTFHNMTGGKKDIFVPEVEAKAMLIAKRGLDGATVTASVIPRHSVEDSTFERSDGFYERKDGYWPAYIVGDKTDIEVVVDVTAKNNAALASLDCVLLRLAYISYGPHGRTPQEQQVVLPLRFPEPTGAPADTDGSSETAPKWQEVRPGLKCLSVPTHLLCHLDDPVSVIKRYVEPHARPGDIVTVGETPLAVMQGRFRHPVGIRPGWVARFVCKLFNRYSSIATACGMQALIDVVGAARVLFAAAVGAICRVVRLRGVFYRVAGEQAALIDDITGTMPPYDQFVTLGPTRVAETVEAIQSRLALEAAVVDVNDLSWKTGAVRVLGRTEGALPSVLTEALLRNPAGNADQQTPIVLIRPSSPDQEEQSTG